VPGRLISPSSHIVVAGAGSIGCFTGGLLAAAGRRVTLLARPRTIAEIAAHDLTLTDFAGLDRTVPAARMTLTEDPACLAGADLILVTVKTAATAAIAEAIAEHAPPAAAVVGLQNGLDGMEILTRRLSGRDLRAGMVPFNVVPMGPGRFHRASSGDILIGRGAQPLAPLLSVPGLPVAETAGITAVQWGKLLLNLNNALNALSGLTLHAQLQDREWRRLMADQMSEALTALRAAGIAVTSTTAAPPGLIPHVLRLPTPLFARIAARMMVIDPSARASMSHDLLAGRATEIDALQGRILRLAEETGTPVPLCRRVAGLIREAETRGAGLPGLSVAQVRAGWSQR
jgi:2-dehydropantoate 2-reductase